MGEDVFKKFKKRLNVLEESVRESAVRYAKTFLEKEDTTPEEALEKGIAKAEMEQRDL